MANTKTTSKVVSKRKCSSENSVEKYSKLSSSKKRNLAKLKNEFFGFPNVSHSSEKRKTICENKLTRSPYVKLERLDLNICSKNSHSSEKKKSSQGNELNDSPYIQNLQNCSKQNIDCHNLPTSEKRNSSVKNELPNSPYALHTSDNRKSSWKNEPHSPYKKIPFLDLKKNCSEMNSGSHNSSSQDTTTDIDEEITIKDEPLDLAYEEGESCGLENSRSAKRKRSKLENELNDNPEKNPYELHKIAIYNNKKDSLQINDVCTRTISDSHKALSLTSDKCTRNIRNQPTAKSLTPEISTEIIDLHIAEYLTSEKCTRKIIYYPNVECLTSEKLARMSHLRNVEFLKSKKVNERKKYTRKRSASNATSLLEESQKPGSASNATSLLEENQKPGSASFNATSLLAKNQKPAEPPLNIPVVSKEVLTKALINLEPKTFSKRDKNSGKENTSSPKKFTFYVNTGTNVKQLNKLESDSHAAMDVYKSRLYTDDNSGATNKHSRKSYLTEEQTSKLIDLCPTEPESEFRKNACFAFRSIKIYVYTGCEQKKRNFRNECALQSTQSTQSTQSPSKKLSSISQSTQSEQSSSKKLSSISHDISNIKIKTSFQGEVNIKNILKSFNEFLSKNNQKTNDAVVSITTISNQLNADDENKSSKEPILSKEDKQRLFKKFLEHVENSPEKQSIENGQNSENSRYEKEISENESSNSTANDEFINDIDEEPILTKEDKQRLFKMFLERVENPSPENIRDKFQSTENRQNSENSKHENEISENESCNAISNNEFINDIEEPLLTKEDKRRLFKMFLEHVENPPENVPEKFQSTENCQNSEEPILSKEQKQNLFKKYLEYEKNHSSVNVPDENQSPVKRRRYKNSILSEEEIGTLVMKNLNEIDVNSYSENKPDKNEQNIKDNTDRDNVTEAAIIEVNSNSISSAEEKIKRKPFVGPLSKRPRLDDRSYHIENSDEENKKYSCESLYEPISSKNGWENLYSEYLYESAPSISEKSKEHEKLNSIDMASEDELEEFVDNDSRYIEILKMAAIDDEVLDATNDEKNDTECKDASINNPTNINSIESILWSDDESDEVSINKSAKKFKNNITIDKMTKNKYKNEPSNDNNKIIKSGDDNKKRNKLNDKVTENINTNVTSTKMEGKNDRNESNENMALNDRIESSSKVTEDNDINESSDIGISEQIMVAGYEKENIEEKLLEPQVILNENSIDRVKKLNSYSLFKKIIAESKNPLLENLGLKGNFNRRNMIINNMWKNLPKEKKKEFKKRASDLRNSGETLELFQ